MQTRAHEPVIAFRSVAESLRLFRRRDPQKTAIVDLDQKTSISFGELDQLAADIAADLKARGIRRGDIVVLLAHEVIEKLLLWLGLWRIGAAVCPITVELHEAHLTFIANLVRPKLILMDEELEARQLQVGVAPLVRFG